MKWSNTILITTMAVGLAGIFGSNAIMKKEYDEIDKSDKYWNYKMFTDKPFKHIRITGGNVSNIVYEQSPHSSLKVLKAWRGSEDGTIKAIVSNDTLTIDFNNNFTDLYEKYWLRDAVTVRITGPVLKSIVGTDTRLVLNKFNQPSLKVDLYGNSRLAVNSYSTHFEKIDISQSDSSLATFNVSKELFVEDSIKINTVVARGSGTSLLNLKSATIDSLQLNLTDGASVALNGYSLKKWK